jgi:hypothetical protein
MARDDPETLFVQDILMDETIDLIKNGIYRKLAAARHMIDYDKEIAAGDLCLCTGRIGKTASTKEIQTERGQICGKIFREIPRT